MTTIIEELKEIMSTGKEHDVVEFLEKIEIEIEVYAKHTVPKFDNNQFSVDVSHDFYNNETIQIPLIDVYNREYDAYKILNDIERSKLDFVITINNMHDVTLEELKDIVNIIDIYEEEAWR